MSVMLAARNIDPRDFHHEMVTIFAEVDGVEVCSVRVGEADLTNTERMARILDALGVLAREAT